MTERKDIVERLKIGFAASLMNANAGMRWLDHDSMDEMIESAWVGFENALESSGLERLQAENAAMREAGDELADKIWILRCDSRDSKGREAAESAVDMWRAALESPSA